MLDFLNCLVCRKILLIPLSMFLLQPLNAATLNFTDMTINSNTGTVIGPQANTLTSPSVACTTTTPTASFNSTLTNTASSGGVLDTASLTNLASNQLTVELFEGGNSANAGIQNGWITTYTLDNFSQALSGVRLFGNGSVMPNNSTDHVDWTISWSGGSANFVQSAAPLQLYTCGGTSVLIPNGPITSPACFRIDDNNTQGEMENFPAGAANFDFQLPVITSLTIESEVTTETTGGGSNSEFNFERFAIDFDNVDLDPDNNCLSATQEAAAAEAAAARNIPIFGPLGLLFMLGGLLRFGRIKAS